MAILQRQREQNREDMNNNFSIINKCRLCESSNIKNVIEFGEIALANNYLSKEDEKESLYPLTVIKCDECGHVQLKETINPNILFDNYAYASSDSPALNKHFEEYAKEVVTYNNLSEYSQVLEIACNDGVLLKQFEKLGLLNLIGVEPAKNIAAICKNKTKANIYNEYFDEQTASKIVKERGFSDVICANNVLAHVANINEFIKGIEKALSDKGVFVFENAYLLDTIKNLYFDQVYHEHLQFFGIKPLQKFLLKNGLEIFRIKRVNTQGGSFRIFAKKVKNKEIKIDESVNNFLNEEEANNLYDDSTLQDFKDKITKIQKEFSTFLNEVEKNNKTVSCYGCPAKFALLSKTLGFNKKNIKYVVDDSPLKQNKFSPYRRIKIVNQQKFIDEPTDYCIISSWNMSDSIIQKNKQYKGNFVIPLPSIKVISSRF